MIVGLCDPLAVLAVLMEPVRHTPGLEGGGCGSVAAALQTVRTGIAARDLLALQCVVSMGMYDIAAIH